MINFKALKIWWEFQLQWLEEALTKIFDYSDREDEYYGPDIKDENWL